VSRYLARVEYFSIAYNMSRRAAAAAAEEKRVKAGAHAFSGDEAEELEHETREPAPPPSTLSRGYFAEFHWNDHMPGSEDLDESLAIVQTEVVSNLPVLFNRLFHILDNAEHAVHGRTILAILDKRLCKPAVSENDGANDPRKTLLTGSDGILYLILANRREHIKLLQKDMKELGICPRLVDLYQLNAGESSPLKSKLPCTCIREEEPEEVPVAEEAEDLNGMIASSDLVDPSAMAVDQVHELEMPEYEETSRKSKSRKAKKSSKSKPITALIDHPSNYDSPVPSLIVLVDVDAAPPIDASERAWMQLSEAMEACKNEMETTWKAKVRQVSQRVNELRATLEQKQEEVAALRLQWLSQIKSTMTSLTNSTQLVKRSRGISETPAPKSKLAKSRA
jgi:hypothetical protein